MTVTTVDNLTLLEERVEGLVKQMEKIAKENETLRETNKGMKAQIEDAQRDSGHFKSEIKRLEKEIKGSLGKEDVIRDRLQGILDKIDAITGEISSAAPVE